MESLGPRGPPDRQASPTRVYLAQYSGYHIMASVRSRYGKMRKTTRKNLEEKMSSRLASTDSFETHVSHLREQFLTFEKGGHQILEEKRVNILRKPLTGHSIIEKILNQYDFKNCDDTLWTFENIVEFIDDHLPNLQSFAQIAAEDHANVMTSEAYVALEAEVKKLKASLPTPKKRQGGKGKGKNKKAKKNRTNGNESSTNRADIPTDKPTKYCHAHGLPRGSGPCRHLVLLFFPFFPHQIQPSCTESTN